MKTLDNMFDDIHEQLNSFGNLFSLMDYFSIDSLLEMHNQLIKKEIRCINKGIRDGRYSRNIVDRKLNEINCSLQEIISLHDNLRSHDYFPKPSQKVFITKSNGKLRTLGIPAYRDKIVQGIMAKILTAIYEPQFYNCSYAYRINRNCHDAIMNLNETIKKDHTNYIVKTDIKGCFDNINHQRLLSFIEPVIKDRFFLGYLHRFLKAGILDNGNFVGNCKGCSQGHLLSPILANIYLHNVLDTWFENDIKTKFKHSFLIRYADDILAGFSSLMEAKQYLTKMEHRLWLYNLKLQDEKTQIIPFSNSNDRFNYLGFEISKNGSSTGISVKTGNTKSIQKKEYIYKIINKDLYIPILELISEINNVLRGYYLYYGYTSNIPWLEEIRYYTINILTDEIYNRPDLESPISELFSGFDFFILRPPTYDKLIQL